MRTWLYLPTGNKVEFEFSDSSIPEDDYANAIDYTNRMLKLGASVNAPGLEAGEEKHEISHVARWIKDDDDGRQSHRIDLYVNHPQMTMRYMPVYIKDTPEECAKFSQATGIQITDIKLLPTKGTMNRDDDRGGYIKQLPKPVIVVSKPNPNYDETKKDSGKPARLFVRWESVGTPTQPSAPFGGALAGIQPATLPPQPAPETAKTDANSSAAPAVATGTPKAAENTGNGDLPNWFNTPLQTCFGAFKTYILPNLYENNTWHMNSSLKKHGISDGKSISAEWATKTAGEVLEYLKHRKDEPADNPDLLPEAS